MAFFVSSWKSTLWNVLPFFLSISAVCHAMASPSLSGSGARYISDVSPAACLKDFITFCLPGIFRYLGLNPSSMLIPISFAGRRRSFIWPTVAATLYCLPRYFLMVLIFVGDSTTTRGLLTILPHSIWHGFVKNPTSSLRYIPRHCGVLYVRLIPRNLRALNLKLFTLPLSFDLFRFYQI